jgi:hypothetical protein
MQSTGHDSLALKFHLLGDPIIRGGADKENICASDLKEGCQPHHASLALKIHLPGDPRRRWQKEYTRK